MAKKLNRPELEPVIDQEIIATAKRALDSERVRVVSRCTVCDAEAAPTSTENLCWVCRRLKISAWRDTDPQLSVQE